jgi:hypothetical protein
MQSLAERAQARVDPVKEGAKAHVEITVTREAMLQANVEATAEIKPVKNSMAWQAEKEVAALKKELVAA